MEQAHLQTPLGWITLQGGPGGLSSLRFSEVPLERDSVPSSLARACEQIQQYFRGDLKTFDLSLELRGTAFQKKVWEALLEIPFGATWSYGELATRLGDPGAVRAVAAANARNPVWIVVPCHRVVGADGSLTGYAGGLARKKWLLEHESPLKQTSLFGRPGFPGAV
jgi:methylated-DNA-[protein]-cysteine S-methyltransferase